VSAPFLADIAQADPLFFQVNTNQNEKFSIVTGKEVHVLFFQVRNDAMSTTNAVCLYLN
jgi:hypothetical protein